MNLDPKLVAGVVSAIVARLALELGISNDETVQAVLPLVVAAIVSYLTPNDGTVLRTVQEDGNPVPPPPVRTIRKPKPRKKAA